MMDHAISKITLSYKEAVVDAKLDKLRTKMLLNDRAYI